MSPLGHQCPAAKAITPVEGGCCTWCGAVEPTPQFWFHDGEWHEILLPLNDPRHGTYAGYNAGCKQRGCCPLEDTCVDAERRYQNAYGRDQAYGRARKVSSLGTVRRLQALMAVGWPHGYLAERLGVRVSNLHTHTRYPTVRTARHNAVKALYAELLAADAFGPSERTRKHAQVHGFLPPQAWDGVDMDDPDATPDFGFYDEVPDAVSEVDEIAVDRACMGRPPEHLTRAERVEVVKRLHALGLTDAQIETRSRIGGHTARRIRQQLGLPTHTTTSVQQEVA